MSILSAGEVELVGAVFLIDTKNSARHNITSMMTDLRIYESVYTSKMNGYIALADDRNLIATVPIVGHEIIEFEFKTPGLRSFSKQFIVTGVGQRQHRTQSITYTLEFISIHAWQALNTRISKSYQGNTTDIAKAVYSAAFKATLLGADKSSNAVRFISPFWDPMTIIHHAAKLSIYANAKITTPNFLFYEANTGHKFKSLTTMFNQPSHTTFYFDKNPARATTKSGDSTRDINREYATAKSLTFVEMPNLVVNTMQGAMGTTVFGMNFLTKAINVNKYLASTDFNKTAHTNQTPIVNLATPAGAGLYALKHTFPKMYDEVTGDVSGDIVSKAIPLLAQLEMFKINMVVHGRTDIEVGMMVFVIMNPFSGDAGEQYDMMYSGKYLITKIEHAFTHSRYEMNMELIKDSTFGVGTK